MPTSVLHHILWQIVGGSTCDRGRGVGGSGAGSAAAAGSGTAAASGSPRDIVHLAFTCKAMLQAVEAAEQLWQQQCRRLGWRCVTDSRGPSLPVWWRVACTCGVLCHIDRRIACRMSCCMGRASCSAASPCPLCTTFPWLQPRLAGNPAAGHPHLGLLLPSHGRAPPAAPPAAHAVTLPGPGQRSGHPPRGSRGGAG